MTAGGYSPRGSRSSEAETPHEIPLNTPYSALPSKIAHVDGKRFMHGMRGRFCTSTTSDIRSRRGCNLHVPLNVRAALLGHRLRGARTDSPAEMRSRVATLTALKDGPQQLREAVTRLHVPLLSYGLSDGQNAPRIPAIQARVNAASDPERGWWSQRDLNPCFSSTATSPLIIAC